jgi:hypothetical protein
MSLTQVAKKYRISRATVCRLVNEFGGEEESGVPRISDKKTSVPVPEGSDLPTAA